MPIVFNGVDNEFAASTGSNVNVTENTSRFDNPPNGSKDLVITSNEGDTDPRLFELGDAYDVSWGGQGGGGYMEDAVVIRSDMSPDGVGGIIVFEGTDENGDLAQIIWTPDFDLEGWYNDNYNPSDEPQFYTEDTNASYSHMVACYVTGTMIATPDGARAVEELSPGDPVLTHDSGAQPVRWITTSKLPGFGRAAPVVFEAGTLGNSQALAVSPQHRILAGGDAPPGHAHDGGVLIPAKAFLGLHGVQRTRQPEVHYVHLLLEAHHVLAANGAASESLYLGPQAKDQLATSCAKDAMPKITHAAPARRLLNVRQGRAYLARKLCHPAPKAPSRPMGAMM
ncbi:Hint domain-containing protein [Litoreibacter ponti]|uniref:Hint domain-containing protein n=1 Tax=Litoreibacter ponti TaxID=1510457 RepID=A0A2T6BLZ4_9RHOB|nr:Hint domain-containing protein [Litoreibacter ponti]PTX57072.1 Hint domain-containing protein [Litoreibacter ponti]